MKPKETPKNDCDHMDTSIIILNQLGNKVMVVCGKCGMLMSATLDKNNKIKYDKE